MAQFPAEIALSALQGSGGFRLIGGAAGDYAGGSVSGAGDVNGDGFADVIVGARYAHGSGAAYVVFGRAQGFASSLSASSLNGKNGFRLVGTAPGDGAGQSVASAGDINGDGFGDLIVGAHHAGINGEYSGASYVIFGKASGFTPGLNLAALNGINGFRMLGGAEDDRAGASVAGAGDINGDGLADVIVGAMGADLGGYSQGSSYVVFGRKGGFASSIELSALDGGNGFRLDGAANFDFSGSAVGPAGDVNGDGIADLIVGAPFADLGASDRGASYVVFGKTGGFASAVSLAALDGATGFRLVGVAANDASGASVQGAGDVNGDGFADLIVGSLQGAGDAADSGAAYVVFGRAAGFASSIDLSALDGGNGFRLDGFKDGDYAGYSVGAAGDVNGDGFADVIVGAPGSDVGHFASGSSYVVFGKPSGFAPAIDLSSLDGEDGFRVGGVAKDDASGSAVAAAGDVNGDGFADLIVGAYKADPNGPSSGAGYIVFGRKPDAAVSRTGSAAGQTLAGGEFNDTLAALGGNDRLHGNGGSDMLNGGIGNDTAFGGAGNDSLWGGAGIDSLAAGLGNDRLSGDAGADTLDGGQGNDLLIGGSEADRMFGGAGADTFNPGAGRDTMTGGAGADVFAFAIQGWGGDMITDFEDGIDRLRFRHSIADGLEDFTIAGNGSASVVLRMAGQSLIVKSAVPLTLDAADFHFLS